MRKLFTLLLLATTGVLSNCATQPASQNVTADRNSQELIERLQAELAGSYSTYAQVRVSDRGAPVIDLNVRPLYGADGPTFLFESQPRGTFLADYDIYWLKQNQQSGQAEMHFARLTGSELSLPLQETLAIAWQRVLPGCVMALAADARRIYAQTRPDTCRFENPLQGETRLYRSLSLNADGLEMETITLLPGEKLTAGDKRLILQKQRVYQGQVSLGSLDPATGEYSDWQPSMPFDIRDDGRVVQLYDSTAQQMRFGVRLARMQRRDGEPPYLKLAVVNTLTGATQAYSWFKDGPEPITMKLEWFRAELKLKPPATEAGEQ